MNTTISSEITARARLAANLLAASMKVVDIKLAFLVGYKTIESYARNLRGAVRGLWNGTFDTGEFIFQVGQALERAFNEAWTEGARSQGLEPDERSPEEQAKLDEMIATQSTFIPGLAEWVLAHSKLKPAEPFTPTPAEPVPTGDIEDMMLTEDINYASGADNSLGGINESYRVGIGDEEAIIKPGANIWEKEMESEVFASRISDELGFDIVPETILRESGTYNLPDGSVANVDASMQQWVKNGTLGKDVDWSTLDERSYSQMVMMDGLSNNADRHLANWMTVDNRVVAIDNGLGFRRVQEGYFHHNQFGKGIDDWLENAGGSLSFNAGDIDAITKLASDKNFRASFIDTFDERTWTSFEYQAKVLAKNKDMLVSGISGEYWDNPLEDL